MAVISFEDVKVMRGTSLLLDVPYLEVADGELLVVLGPSGAGKSMLLRAVSGLEPLAGGRVLFDDRDMTDVLTHERGVAMVFQDQALFPFLSVRGNVGFPLKIRRTPPDEIAQRVEAEARVLEIEHLLERHPGELSAGHQQLVQAARALVRVPDVFLMDEPLASLDAHLRVQMRQEFKLLQQGYGVTTIFVTHDRDEAMVMGDRVMVLNRGVIQQVGPPMELYRWPENRFVAGFIGAMSFLPGVLRAGNPGYWIKAGDQDLRAWTPTLAGHEGHVELGIRPEDVVLDETGYEAAVGRSVFLGDHGLADCELGPEHKVQMRTEGNPPRTGGRVKIRLRRLHVFDPRTGLVIGRIEDGAA